jgi:acyl carrier protein
MQIYLLDRYCQPVPVGVPGEIYIGGIGLARGYVRQPEQTAQRFVPHPFSSQAGERLYRTGDLGRYRPDGRIDFLGRLDQQVKIRGYRIEPGEIEAVLLQHPHIKACVVIARADKQGDRQLVAYIVASEFATFIESDARVYLQGKLPDYMLPSLIVLVEALPLTPNGKVDRKALLAPELSASTSDVDYLPPTNDVERVIADIWQDILDLETVGIHDNFFDLGGHSLLLAGVRVRLQEALNRDVPVVDLFHYPTISALARYLDQQQDKALALQPVQDQARKRRDALKRQQQRMQKVQEDQ